ncbi:hypothetical protein GGTG_06355 [Gaeumannomyces tritici R3-111a-1]|uniref:Uncharacterized protein n=1 Tax=Gaeumannomyces tritici (strain R3-111a-1) TaxID=644352 RepID=J3NYK3_GAET3|nr:hypothetical protein GGTG_06355 [Gaeumannomyces tritici R3-111a-1]EJT76436.1 hypothetical protein GGTG_06355 [Gaeumannomyces tritici R3-111a-1]
MSSSTGARHVQSDGGVAQEGVGRIAGELSLWGSLGSTYPLARHHFPFVICRLLEYTSQSTVKSHPFSMALSPFQIHKKFRGL